MEDSDKGASLVVSVGTVLSSVAPWCGCLSRHPSASAAADTAVVGHDALLSPGGNDSREEIRTGARLVRQTLR
jgi:hypothetical protein